MVPLRVEDLSGVVKSGGEGAKRPELMGEQTTYLYFSKVKNWLRLKRRRKGEAKDHWLGNG